MTAFGLSIKERFLLHVSIPENPNACWKWIGGKFSNGYGTFRINDKVYNAHRISFELFIGPIPEGLFVCHSCDNRVCVNPAHLWLGTHQDNMTDRNNKNRQFHNIGESHGMHKLTEQQVYQIREKLKQGYTNIETAKMFKVNPVTISDIKVGKTWSWLK